MRVLLIGALPTHFADNVRTEAANQRTWQFLAPLLAQHECCLISWGNPTSLRQQISVSYENLECWWLNFGKTWIRFVKSLVARFQPDVLVGITYRGAMYATRLGLPLPLWVDFYGDISVENQGYAYVNPAPSGTWSASWIEQVVYRRGDVFSTCSQRQKYAVIGKLGLLRRLTGPSLGYEFVYAIPPGADARATRSVVEHDRRTGIFAEIPELASIPQDAIVVLWSGSYNTWTDLDTLYQGLEEAIEAEPRLHYVSTGKVAGNASAYQDFADKIQASPRRAHFHLLGWQSYAVVQQLYSAADIGISIDSSHYEVLLGTRTRLVEMASHGLVLVSTAGTELAESLATEGALCLFASHSPSSLAAKLIQLAQNAEMRTATGQRAREIARRDYTFERTTLPLQHWVNAPTVAPDKAERTLSTWLYLRSRLATRQILWGALGRLE